MRILFDHGTPYPLRASLKDHSVSRTQELGWDRFTNGELLNAAEEEGFDLLLTTDKSLRYQQNLAGRRIAVVALSNAQWPVLRLHVDRVVEAVSASTPGSFRQVEIAGENK